MRGEDINEKGCNYIVKVVVPNITVRTNNTLTYAVCGT